jgi:hypothetical protein
MKSGTELAGELIFLHCGRSNVHANILDDMCYGGEYLGIGMSVQGSSELACQVGITES